MDNNFFFEYLLVANPGSYLENILMQEKQHFYNTYQPRISNQAKSSISIAHFLASEPMESIVMRKMEQIFGMQHGFIVMLNKYGGFSPHTIYLGMQDNRPFRQLALQLRSLDEYIQASACPPVKLITNPHLSIAQDLPSEIYYKAIEEYRGKKFNESFVLEELVLLKRQQQFETYKTMQVLRLKPASTGLFSDVA